MDKKNDLIKIVAENKKAGYLYHILDKYEAGIVLLGPEVKAIRKGAVNFTDSYVDAKGTELFLVDFHITATVSFGTYNPIRKRKLLLHKSEILRLIHKMNEKSLTLIPLRIYIHHQMIKFEIALAKGKTNYDKRRSIEEKDLKRELVLERW